MDTEPSGASAEHLLSLAKSELRFVSRLPAASHSELESLLFFHPDQERVSRGILESVEKYGLPRIHSDGDFLRVTVGDSMEVQSLYAIVETKENSKLVGIMIYSRVDQETLVLLHIATAHDYSSSGKHSGAMLTVRFVTELRQAAQRIKGVKSILVMYGLGAPKKIPVRE